MLRVKRVPVFETLFNTASSLVFRVRSPAGRWLWPLQWPEQVYYYDIDAQGARTAIHFAHVVAVLRQPASATKVAVLSFPSSQV